MDDEKFQTDLRDLHDSLYKLMDLFSEGINGLLESPKNKISFKEAARRFHQIIPENELDLTMDKLARIESSIVRRLGGTANDYCECSFWGGVTHEVCAHSLASEWVAMGRAIVMDRVGSIFIADQFKLSSTFLNNLKELNFEKFRIRTMLSREFMLLTPQSVSSQRDNVGQAKKVSKKNLRRFGQKELEASEEFKKRRNEGESGLTLKKFCEEYASFNFVGSAETLAKNLSSRRGAWDPMGDYK